MKRFYRYNYFDFELQLLIVKYEEIKQYYFKISLFFKVNFDFYLI